MSGVSMDMHSLVPERLLADYEPASLLKAGQRRQTLLLQHRSSHAWAVLKRSRDDQEDLVAECALLRRMAGEGIPAALEGFREGNCTYLLREYVPGESLLDYAQKRGPLPTREVYGIGLSLCRTLKRLHGQNPPVIHRDIKLENIIRTPEGECILIDLGIARQYDAQARRDTQVLGTPGSAPPEQFGYRQTDPRSDVYALGVVLHELASGEPRLDKGTLDPALQAVVDRCTRFDPVDRYADAAGVEQALLRASRPKRRFRCLLWLILFAVAVGAATWSGFVAVSGPAAAPESSPAVYSFASPAIEAEVCRQMGKEPGTVTAEDLEQIETLILCGGQWGTDWDQISTAGASLFLDGAEVAETGAVDTLEDLSAMKNLHTLALCSQKLQDLSPLADCRQLCRLALHGNRITDLSHLASCSQLQELIVSDNPVADFSPLAACPDLWSIDAGATALTDLDSFAGLPALYRLYLRDAAGLRDINGLSSTSINTLFLQPVSREQLASIGGLSQLHSLFLWNVEGMEDLTPLAELDHLEYLYIHSDSIASLEGAQALKSLGFLDVRTRQTLDLSPLAGLNSLTTLSVYGLVPADWAALGDIPNLVQVNCAPEQADVIRAALGSIPFQLNSERQD